MPRIFAFIDGANLHKGIRDLGWHIDYRRLRRWLSDKYGIERAYLFIGLVPKNKDLYTSLQEAGFTLVFKEITYDGLGNVKGNCDADLVLKATCEAYEKAFDQAVLVSSDGDYSGLVKFLHERRQFCILLSPSPAKKCSILLKRTGVRIAYLNDQRSILEYVK
ncbi:NYN domain-containing protein [Candidatus Uhrbacteria bacterium]|nr:NYN domain-containing protein [Candidatus Uhrbacteria bacterium]